MTGDMRVTVAYAAPGVEAIVDVIMPAGATVIDAVEASGLRTRFATSGGIQFAIFGQRAAHDTPLRDGDRVELTRHLTADPKEARRARATGRTSRIHAGKT